MVEAGLQRQGGIRTAQIVVALPLLVALALGTACRSGVETGSAVAALPADTASEDPAPVDAGTPVDVLKATPDLTEDAPLDTPPPAELPLPATPDVAAGQDLETPDLSPPDAGPVNPLLATGKFVDQTALLGPALATDPGDKTKQEPSSSSALLTDLDKDGVTDFVMVDGIDQAIWGRAVQPWKWIKTPLLKAKEPGLRAIAVTDDNGDGYPEIVLGGGKIYYLTRTKDENYVEQASLKGLVNNPGAHVSAITPADLDSDGQLDLVMGQYSCSPNSEILAFVNQGNGTYVDATAALGLTQYVTSWAVLATDFDGDRHVDLLTLQETCDPKGGNAYFHNRGFPDKGKRFEQLKVPPLFRAPEPEGGSPMGGSVGDIDGDGDLDYVFSEIGYREPRQGGMDMTKPDLAALAVFEGMGTHLLIRQKDGTFTSTGLKAGLSLALNENAQTMVGWSARMWDFDLDGHLDVLMTHGHDFAGYLLADEGGSRPVLYRNQGDATFVEVSQAFGLPAKHLSRAMATADVDGDGDLDFFMGGQNMQPVLLRNDIQAPGQWLTVRLQGQTSNPFGLGARLELKTDKRVYVAEMSTQAPTFTQDQALVHFGVPKGEVPADLVVKWPSGFDQVVPVGKLGQHLVIVEPPLVTVSQRFVIAAPGLTVQVQVRGFDPAGKLLPPGTALSLELEPGSSGEWTGPLQCQPDGTCSRKWQPPTKDKGLATVIATIDGKVLKVRPKIRSKPQWP